MKKTLLYILVISTLIYSFTVVAQAYSNSAENHRNDNKILIADDRKYEPTLIPKPDTLPGPTPEEQAKSNKATGGAGVKTIIANILLPKATTGLIGFVALTSFLMLVIAGVRFVVAYGNDEAVGKAKTQIIYAIAGLILALLAYTIVTIISNLELVPKDEQKTSYIETTYV